FWRQLIQCLTSSSRGAVATDSKFSRSSVALATLGAAADPPLGPSASLPRQPRDGKRRCASARARSHHQGVRRTVTSPSALAGPRYRGGKRTSRSCAQRHCRQCAAFHFSLPRTVTSYPTRRQGVRRRLI